MNQRYVIRLSPRGYLDTLSPGIPVPVEEATRYNSRKEAEAARQRVGEMWVGWKKASIETVNKQH
jgi:hypothetical protein